MAKYKLKEGVVIFPYGSNTKIDKNNLTDEIAEYLLATKKATLEQFEKLETKIKQPKTTK